MAKKLQQLLARPVVRGFLWRCPKCGEGRMFRALLKVADSCPHCGEEWHHHRADDLPAHLVIVIVGHIVVAMTLAVQAPFALPLWLHALLWLPMTAALALALIQQVNGAVVAIQ